MKYKTFIKKIFIYILTAVMISGVLRAVIFPKDISVYENRVMNQLPALTSEGWFSGNFQNSTEDALSDQVPLSSYFKKAYNLAHSEVIRHGLAVLTHFDPNAVCKIGNLRIYRDYILYNKNDYSEVTGEYDAVISSYNTVAEKVPETDFLFYYIETDKTMDVITGDKNPSLEYLSSIADGTVSGFEIDNFNDYSEYFSRTDHHWNQAGAYRAYTEIADLLGIPESEIIVPVETDILDYIFTGSKAIRAGLSTFTEKPIAYRFEYPEFNISYGAEEAYFRYEPEIYSYGGYYGGDNAELVLDTGNTEKNNILIIGDSYDNAIVKLIASHFNKTYSVDLRYYADTHDGNSLQLTSYIQEKNISTVIVVGSDFLFADTTFCAGGD